MQVNMGVEAGKSGGRAATIQRKEDSITNVFALTRLSEPQRRLLRAAAEAAGPAAPVFLVGGVVRDGLRRRPGVDLDVAVPSAAVTVARRAAAVLGGSLVVLDEARGTARVHALGHRLDVADFRAPGLEADLALRDFTVDALAVPARTLLRDGRAAVVDPTGGLADLRARRLRLTGPAALEDDPVRGLRGVRLAAALGFALTPSTARHIRAAAKALRRVSPERVRDELLAMLALARSERAVRHLDALGLLAAVIPEVAPMRRTRQPAPHRFNVLEHSLRALGGADRVVARPHALAPHGPELAAHLREDVGGGVDRGQVLRLAALLHDVAKPETRKLIGGRVRFFDHDVIGAERAQAIGERLRLPARVTGLLARLVRHHLRPMHLASAGEVTRRARHRLYRDLGEDCRDLLLLALVDAAAVRGASPLALWPRAHLVRDLLGGWPEEDAARAAPPLLRGEDVMARFALSPGPEVGRLLARAREAQALRLVSTRAEALAFLDSPSREP